MTVAKCHNTPLLLSKGPTRMKRGRYSDPFGRGRGQELSTEDKLESLIVRLGEKVLPYKVMSSWLPW